MVMWRFGLLLAAGVLTAIPSKATELPYAQYTDNILEAIEKDRPARTAKDLKAARQLNADGDRAYKRRRYSKASSMYRYSSPNYPNAYAYIMTSDAHWRAVIQHHESKAGSSGGTSQSCSLVNDDFAHRISLDVATNYEVGLALAQKDGDQHLMNSTLYRRARESATCLQAVAQYYEAEPASACVDIAKLRACLGEPLIR